MEIFWTWGKYYISIALCLCILCGGTYMSTTKADLLVCVSELVLHHDTVKAHEADMVILDGAAILT